jgi:hypothetical protein
MVTITFLVPWNNYLELFLEKASFLVFSARNFYWDANRRQIRWVSDELSVNRIAQKRIKTALLAFTSHTEGY